VQVGISRFRQVRAVDDRRRRGQHDLAARAQGNGFWPGGGFTGADNLHRLRGQDLVQRRQGVEQGIHQIGLHRGGHLMPQHGVGRVSGLDPLDDPAAQHLMRRISDSRGRARHRAHRHQQRSGLPGCGIIGPAKRAPRVADVEQHHILAIPSDAQRAVAQPGEQGFQLSHHAGEVDATGIGIQSLGNRTHCDI